MKRLTLLLFFSLFAANVLLAQTLTPDSTPSRRVATRSHHPRVKAKHSTARSRLQAPVAARQTATAGSLRSQVVAAALPQFARLSSVVLAPSTPQLTAVDPYANPANPSDPLKPARPYWYSADQSGLKILRLTDNSVVYTVPWPQTIDIAQPDGSYLTVNAPPGGWEPVGMIVSYPTEEQLASNSETPVTNVYVVMAHSGYEWQSNSAPPDLRDPNLRDTLVVSTDPAKESAMLVAVDVTDPTYPVDLYPLGPPIAGGILGHGAGQPAYEPGTGNFYVGNMPSMSLPTTPAVPNDLTSFVSVVFGLASPSAEAGEVGGTPTITILCGPEHPEEGLLKGVPVAWPCLAEGGEGPFAWEFTGLPSWLIPHPDKLTGVLDGIIYGTPPADGTYTFQVRVTDNGAEPPFTTGWTTVTLNVIPTGVAPEGEAGFEVGIPGAMVIEGTGTCDLAPTASPGSLVPKWVEVATVPGRENPSKEGEITIGCVVMGTAPISGEYYEFDMPNFKFAYPWDREEFVVSGNVAGPYVFDPVPAGVTLSGLAWHQIEKIHDPSTEADILNAEFIGVDPLTGQLYRVLLPQGELEVGDVVGPPETSVETDTVSTEGAPLAAALAASRSDIANQLTGSRVIAFGNLAVEADRDIYVTAPWILDAVNSTSIPIGGPTGSILDIGAMVKVSSGTASTINLPGVQAYSLGLDSDLAPAIPGSEPGQKDNGGLWVTGTNTGNVAVVDSGLGEYAQILAVPSAVSLGGAWVNPATRFAYVAGQSLQNVTIFGPGTPEDTAPVIWSAGTATFTVGSAGSFTVTASGSPTPALSYTGTLPGGVTFTDKGDGTATLAGTPDTGTEGSHPIVIKAANGVPPDATQNFTLVVNTATGTAPAITSASTTSFTVGSAGSFTVTTTGSPAPALSYTGTLPGGVTFTDKGDGTATLAGTPTTGTEGSHPLTIRAANGVPPDATQNFTLVVNPQELPPAVTLSPVSLSFGKQAINTTSVAKVVTLTNTGAGPLTISSIEASVNFAVASTTCGSTLPAHAKCTVNVTFTPAALGALTGTLKFTDNAPNSPQTVSLSGTGAAQVTLTPPSMSFGAQALGTPSTAKIVTLTNNLPTALTITGTSFTGTAAADYAQTNTCGSSVAAKATCRISVTFTPQATGVRPATLSVSDNANNSPQTVSLTGTGLIPATLAPASVAYGAQAVGTTSLAKTFTLTNNQSVSLTNIAISPSGDFAVSATTCTSSLAAKGKCTINVTFAPTITGVRTGTLTVSDSASNSPQTASLTGTGVVPATLTPASATYASQTVGTTSLAKTFTLTNNQNVSLTNIAISPSGDFAVSATTCTSSLAAKGKCTINVTFTPAATGMRTGMLTVSDSASNSPQTSKLTGTGK